MKRKKAGDSKSRQNIIFNVSKQYIKKKKEAYWHFRKKLSFKIRNVKLSDVLQMIASGLTKNVYMDGELFGVVGDELRECKFKNLATSSL